MSRITQGRLPGSGPRYNLFSVDSVNIEGVTNMYRETHVGAFVQCIAVGGAQAVLTTSAVGGWIEGDVIYFSRLSAGAFEVTPAGGVSIRNPAAGANLEPENASGMARYLGDNEWLLSGAFE